MYIIANPSKSHYLAYGTQKGYHWRKGERGHQAAARFKDKEEANKVAGNYACGNSRPHILVDT